MVGVGGISLWRSTYIYGCISGDRRYAVRGELAIDRSPAGQGYIQRCLWLAMVRMVLPVCAGR